MERSRPWKKPRVQLSESTALACASEDLGKCLWLAPVLPDLSCFELEHARLAIAPWLNTAKHALTTRNIMERMNAIAHCPGFDPVANSAFWHVLGKSFVIESVGDAPHALFPFQATTFSRFQLSCSFAADPEVLAQMWAIWSTTNPASASMEIRRNVLATLRDSLLESPPMIDVEIACGCYVYDEHGPRPPNVDWTKMRHALQYLHRIWVVKQDHLKMPFQETMRLVLGHLQPHLKVKTTGDDLLDLCGMLAYQWLELKELHCFVPGEVLDKLVCPFRELFRELRRSDTLRSMSWQFEAYNEDCVAVIMSAVPCLASLESFGITFETGYREDAGEHAGITTIEPPSRFYAWLFYALEAGRATSPALKIQVRLGNQIVETARGIHWLVSVLPSSVRDQQQAVGVTHGATAIVKAQTTLTPLQTSFSPHVLRQATRLDVVALYGSDAIVVVPGVGLAAAKQSMLRDWRSRGNPTARNTLICRKSPGPSILGALNAIGSQLDGLSLVDCNISETTIEQAIVAASNLTKFAYLGDDPRPCITPLLQAYERGTCGITTLIFTPETTELLRFDAHPLESDALQPLFAALAKRDHPLAKTLVEFCCDTVPLSPGRLSELVRAVEGNKRLQFVRFCVKPHGGVIAAISALESDKSLLTSESKAAIRALMLCAATTTRVAPDPLSLHALSMRPCIQTIAELAAVRKPRRVSWTMWDEL